MIKNNELENDYVNKVVSVLRKYFTIQREVKTDCKTGRIDLIVTTPTGENFGIECKRADEKKGEHIGRFIKQACRYSENTFKGVKIPIFIAPALSYNYFIMNSETVKIGDEFWHKDRHDEKHLHHTINGLLGSMGVGEIRKSEDFFYFSFSNQVIWTSKKEYKSEKIIGLHEANYKALIKKINS